MIFALDTLSYAKHLRERGVPPDQAEAHAEAARNFMMTELTNKRDLIAAKEELQAAIESLGRRLTLRFAALLLGVGIGVVIALLRLGRI
jgi:hypothetical protein